MDIDNQIDYIADNSNLNYDKREIVKKELNKEKYILDKPKNVDSNAQKYYNPAVKIYSKFLDWDNGWYPVDDLEVLQYCPEYTPTDEAIDKLTNKDILEIGAGNGYWSHVINRNNGSCFATDCFPSDVSFTSEEYFKYHEKMEQGELIQNITRNSEIYPYFETYNINNSNNKEEIRYNLIWERVHIASHHIVPNRDEEYVLLCHPVKAIWVEELLDYIKQDNKKLILVSEWCLSPNGTPFFFKELNENWSLEDTFKVYDWKSMNAGGYIFKPD